MMLVEIASPDMEGLHKQLQMDLEEMSTSCLDAVDPKKVEVCPRIGCEYMRGIQMQDIPLFLCTEPL